MQFSSYLATDRRLALSFLGCQKAGPGMATAHLLKQAATVVEKAACPRWAFICLPLIGLCLGAYGPPLCGQDIATHLAGCNEAVLLAVTLGPGPEAAVRHAEATNIHLAFLMDACASALAQQYTWKAQALVGAVAKADNCFLTGLYCPGYGDFPLRFQHDILRLLNAQTAIGLSAGEAGVLFPRKSATALLGRASQPVTGHRLRCANCLASESCDYRKEGSFCAYPLI